MSDGDVYRGWENVEVEVEAEHRREKRMGNKVTMEDAVDSMAVLAQETAAMSTKAHEALDATKELARVKEEMRKKVSGDAGRLGVWATLDDLKDLPLDIWKAEQEVLDAQLLASDHKRTVLADQQEAVRMAEVDASAEAFAGAVDGKNKEIRDVQLAAFLGRDPGVIAARGWLRAAEDKQAQLEAQVASAELALKGAVNRFKAVCHAAELQTQLVRLLAG